MKEPGKCFYAVLQNKNNAVFGGFGVVGDIWFGRF
jgi:hypothetical protein